MKRLLALTFLSFAALAQTSNYPSALDNNTSLFIVADNIQTTLSNAMLIGDSVAVVTSPTGFVANMIATICDVQSGGKCTAWEHLLVTNVAGNVLTVTRGFAGTSARAHVKGATISILIDAAHQQSLKAAIIAIETALGVNLANVVSGTLPVSWGSTTGNGIPGADNPYTAPNVLAVRDGTVASPQSSSVSPSAVFQRANALPGNIATAFVFDCYSTSGAAANSGCITFNAVIHDQTVAKGGTALRSTVYADVPPAVSALSSATLSTGIVTVLTGSAHGAVAGGPVIIAGTSSMAGLNGTFTVATVADSTHFTFACGGCSGGPGGGGTVTVPVAYFGSWDSIFKVTGPNIRVVGHESDMNNQYGDAGNAVAAQDATFNYALYCSSHKCTTGMYIESGDVGTGQYYFPLKFGANAVVTTYPYIDTTSNTSGNAGSYAADFAWVGNGQFIRWADNTAQGNSPSGKWPIFGVDSSNDTRISAPTGGLVVLGPNLAANVEIAGAVVSVRQPLTVSVVPNYIASETGSNNAIAGALVDAAGSAVALAAGVTVTVKLAHTLQAGANTFNFNAGGAVAIKSSRNVANNIGTAYAATGTVILMYDGTEWVDVTQ